ncbi:MAG: hypothetical protein V1809_08125 [Planctomycetota bacterium]
MKTLFHKRLGRAIDLTRVGVFVVIVSLVCAGCFARSRGLIKSVNPLQEPLPKPVADMGIKKGMHFHEVEKKLAENRILVRFTGNAIWPHNPHFECLGQIYIIRETSDLKGAKGDTVYAIEIPDAEMTDYLRKNGRPESGLPK